MVLSPAHLDRSQRDQVGRGPLHIKQPPARAGTPQQLHQADQGHLGRVGLPVKHRLAGEQASDGHAVQPAGQVAVRIPGLHAVHPAQLVQLPVGGGDAAVDPRPPAPPVGAGGEYLVERGVDPDLGSAGTSGATTC